MAIKVQGSESETELDDSKEKQTGNMSSDDEKQKDILAQIEK